jgi:thiamine pyrophosphate-dependent acetolactate synthase large subunit-like protein
MNEQMQKPDAAARDALDHARAATQELHQAISGALAKRTGATKVEIEGAIQKAKAAADSTRSAMRPRHGAAQEQIKQRLTKAVDKLEAAEKHVAEGLKREAFHIAFGKALAEARTSLQNISEAVAAQRSEHAAKHPVKRAS